MACAVNWRMGAPQVIRQAARKHRASRIERVIRRSREIWEMAWIQRTLGVVTNFFQRVVLGYLPTRFDTCIPARSWRVTSARRGLGGLNARRLDTYRSASQYLQTNSRFWLCHRDSLRFFLLRVRISPVCKFQPAQYGCGVLGIDRFLSVGCNQQREQLIHIGVGA